ncbi:hypothetical protein EDEG_01454 [Edhazardia aedis USNM 41457]|uniref:Uncharacterized protein n=1 Tax=Edhazardia aedis (strain USNM 41457) TaxID=1003232 RepID=J9DSI1_EDHAE|nr:hypothetical protein EDEG_01454 [Edhazardia aedis USNM 41457]|eukprot:EJW04282.1 hypothetical protein EDEG_01454 [Edhazardia aedis USNM 41457]
MNREHIISVFKSATEAINNNNYKTAAEYFQVDVSYTKFLFENFATYKDEYQKHLIIWMDILVLNPFNLCKITQIEKVEEFLVFLKSQYGVSNDFNKIISHCAAQIIKNVVISSAGLRKTQNSEISKNFKKETENELENINKSKFTCDKDLEISKVADLLLITKDTENLIIKDRGNTLIFSILRKLSPLLCIPALKKLRVEANDNIKTKRYIIKAVSYQEAEKETVNYLLSFLDTNNTKMGWTVCKSIVRHCFSIRSESVIVAICKNLSQIYANESLWINTAQVLSFLILKKHTVADSFKIIKKMIFYDIKSEPKSVLVREAGLFLLWSNIRMDAIEILVNDNTSKKCEKNEEKIFFGRFSLPDRKKSQNLINQNEIKLAAEKKIQEYKRNKN